MFGDGAHAQLHFYKRRLTPLRENQKYCNPVSPFAQNFAAHYRRGLLSRSFAAHLQTLHPRLKVSRSKATPHFATFNIADDAISATLEKQSQARTKSSSSPRKKREAEAVQTHSHS